MIPQTRCILTMAAAPSLIFEAFPAVTDPSFLKAGLSSARAKAELDS